MPRRGRQHPDDNVAIVLVAGGLSAGAVLGDGTTLIEDVPFGHKITLTEIAQGQAVIRYGVAVGIPKESLSSGSWVSETRVELPPLPPVNSPPPPEPVSPSGPPIEGLTFDGFRNLDGSVGTRNILAVTTSVQYVSGVVGHSTLAARWHDLMDLDAGRVATGEMPVEEAGQALFDLLIDVASGLAVTAADRLGLYNDLTLFNPAPVT